MLRPDFSSSRSTGWAPDRAQELPRLFKGERRSVCADYQASLLPPVEHPAIHCPVREYVCTHLKVCLAPLW